jgi:hypothetical protein
LGWTRPQGILLIGREKARVATERNGENCRGWNVALIFWRLVGFVGWGRQSQGEMERSRDMNGMQRMELRLLRVTEAYADWWMECNGRWRNAM